MSEPTGRGEAVVLGGGGHAKVLVDLLLRGEGPRPIAILDADPSLHGTDVLGVPVIGGDEALDRHAPGDVVLVNGLGGVGSTTARRALFLRWRARGYRFETLVHPRADVSAHARLNEGVQVLSGAVVGAGASVGENGIVNTRAVIEHDGRVGAHVHVASGAVICGGVELGDGVHVGAGATVIQGVSIGPGTVVGAGAVVAGDLPAGVLAVGVPARVRGPVEVD